MSAALHGVVAGIPPRRLTIAHVVDRIDPSDGGPPTVVARVAAAQALAGHAVRIIARTPACDETTIHNAFGGVTGFDLVARRHLRRPVAPSAVGAMAGALADVDFVHVHGLWRPLLMRAVTHCLRRDLPYCITPHGMLSQWSLSQRTLKKSLALALYWRRALRHASFVQYLNASEAEDAGAVERSAYQRIIPNGVDPAELSPGPPLTDAPHLARGRPYVLFLARLHHSKGPDVLCEAFARFCAVNEDWDLVIAGPDFGYAADVARRIDTLGLAGRVRLAGPVYGADKIALLRGARVLCQPSRHEGFSMTILEALACGVPAVISEQCHFPELAAAGAGAVTPLDPDRIAAALLRYATDEAARCAAGRAGARLVAERYTWSAIATDMIDAYRDAIAAAP